MHRIQLHYTISRDAGDALQPAFQLLIYPATDMRGTSASHHENGSGYLLTRDVIDYFQGHYLDATQYADWRASPLLHSSHAGLPPAFVLTAGYDPLRDEGLRILDDALTVADGYTV